MLLNLLTIHFFLSIIVIVYSGCYIVVRNYSPHLMDVVHLLIFLAIYIFGYMIEIHSISLESALFWNQFQYISLPFISSFWLFVSLKHVRRLQRISFKLRVALFLLPSITFLFRLTNPLHHLFYTGYTFEIVNGMGILHLFKGPWYYVHYGYSILQLVAVSIVFWKVFLSNRGILRGQAIKLAMITLFGFIGIIITSLDIGHTGLDYNAMAFPVSIILFLLLLIRDDAFNINAFARNRVFQDSNQAIVVLDDEDRIVDYNKKAEDYFADQDMDLAYVDVKSYRNTQPEFIDALMSNEKTVKGRDTARGRKYYEFSTERIINRFQRDCGYIKYIQDITEEKKHQMRLEYNAATDDMTKLYNRREFFAQTEKRIAEANSQGKRLFLMMIDIDCFKIVNDRFGHMTGDSVMIALSRMLKGQLSANSIIGRFGGDEFVVLMTRETREDAYREAEKFRQSLAKRRMISSDHEYQVTVSVGIAAYQKGMSVDTLITCADKALYASKNGGRNRISVF
ncbi:MAG: diguanylate cyclase [Eubacteriales bacterium]